MRRLFVVVVGIFALLIVGACSNVSSDDSETPVPRVILVVGATGTQGGAVARELLQRGFSVRGLSRNPNSDSARALIELGAVVVWGDYNDPASLTAALDGVDGIFAVTNSSVYEAPQEIEHGRNLISAAKQANIKHFVFTSVSQADTKTGVPHFDSKYEIEKILYESGLHFTVVRPVEFMNNIRFQREKLMSGLFIDPRSLDDRHQWIAARDIGFLVGEAFDNPDEWIGKTVNIAGDEMTLGAYLALLSMELGVEIKHQQVSWEDFASDSGEEITIMYRWFEDSGYQADVQYLRQRYPNLTTMPKFLQELDWSSTN
jgi:uncharacterized protein YbjT (DUF2867 family)